MGTVKTFVEYDHVDRVNQVGKRRAPFIPGRHAGFQTSTSRDHFLLQGDSIGAQIIKASASAVAIATSVGMVFVLSWIGLALLGFWRGCKKRASGAVTPVKVCLVGCKLVGTVGLLSFGPGTL
jgi:hypothetical protein